jgi:hypothetical protein
MHKSFKKQTLRVSLGLLVFTSHTSDAFTSIQSSSKIAQILNPPSSVLYATKKQTRSSLLQPNETKKKNEERSEEVYGAKFFGGSAIKTELLDEEIEARADKLATLYPKVEEEKGMYARFMDMNAFPDDMARDVAQRMQSAVNYALYEGEAPGPPLYSNKLTWKTPFQKTGDSPTEALTNSLNFYKRVDVAIIAAKSTGESKIQVRWEMSLVWPNLFESRVLLSGTSDLTLDKNSMITFQMDRVDTGGTDGQNIIKAIKPQLDARFWDLYHVGMSPSAELLPRCETPTGTGLFSNYKLFEIPPRLVLQPTLVDTQGREARAAQIIPNHAFSSIIKTTGPKSQRYVPTSPVEVSIRRDANSQNVISWNIALPPEFICYKDELIIGDVEDELEEGAECSYSFQARRRVATLPFGGMPQDNEVAEVRKKLFDQVVKDGLKPKLDNGKPMFFFLQNDAKACFTAEGGLGMAVYDWRPRFAESNEIGIELEL